MHPAPLATFLFSAVLVIWPPLLSPLAAPRIHLRGAARIDAHATSAPASPASQAPQSQGKLVISGTVSDDLGQAVTGMRVAVQVAAVADGANDALNRDGQSPPAWLPLATTSPEMCTDVTQAPVLEGADRLVIPTASTPSSHASGNGAARFCLRLSLPIGRYVARLEARSTGLVDGASVELPVDLALQTVTLGFDPEIRVRSLDAAFVPVDVTASTENDGVATPAPSLTLTLTNESENSLGTAVTDVAGHASFRVGAGSLGPPGTGELRVSFAGNARVGKSARASRVERRTRVALEFPDASGDRLPAGSIDSELTLRVSAKTACASRGCSGLPTGTIEVRLERLGEPSDTGAAQRIVGAGTLRDGEARVAMTFAGLPNDGPERGGDAKLLVRYVPDGPWFLPADARELVQPLRPPSEWRELGFALAGIGVLAWIIASRAAQGAAPVRRDVDPAPSEGRAGRIDVMSSAAGGASRGRVVDAHEGVPIAGARVAIERPGFQRSTVVAEAVSDASGNFVLARTDALPGDQLVAGSAWHGEVRLPAPQEGDLLVTLVARRRALLDRLVAWARRRGRPFDAVPEPTPAQIRRAARVTGAPDAAMSASVGAWAEAVERAAYGGEAVDARRESEVDALAPHEPDVPGRAPGSRAR